MIKIDRTDEGGKGGERMAEEVTRERERRKKRGEDHTQSELVINYIYG